MSERVQALAANSVTGVNSPRCSRGRALLTPSPAPSLPPLQPLGSRSPWRRTQGHRGHTFTSRAATDKTFLTSWLYTNIFTLHNHPGRYYYYGHFMGEDTEKLGGHPVSLDSAHSIYFLWHTVVILARYLYYFWRKNHLLPPLNWDIKGNNRFYKQFYFC